MTRIRQPGRAGRAGPFRGGLSTKITWPQTGAAARSPNPQPASTATARGSSAAGGHPHQPPGLDGPHRPAPRWATRRTPRRQPRYLRKRGIAAVIPVKEDQKKHRRARAARAAAARLRRRTLQGAQHRRALFRQAKQFRASRPATTSASSCTRAPSTSRRSGSGCGIPSHDPRDTPSRG